MVGAATLVVPAAFVVLAVMVPAIAWRRLPHPRRGPLLVAAIAAGIGTVQLVRGARQMGDVRREPYVPASYEGPGLVGPFVSWIRAKFGPLAVSAYVTAFAAAASINMTIVDVGATRWDVGPWLALDIAAASIWALATGLLLRRYDQGAVFRGGRISMRHELDRLRSDQENSGEPPPSAASAT
ncbi:MAG: hypothetical protein ACYDD4_02765 [Acidimicrobiales bacterium]